MNLKFFIPLLLSFHIASAMEDVALSVLPKTHELKPDYETIRSLAKGSLGGMAIWNGARLLNITSHESGHAAIVKTLFNEPKMYMTIGSMPSDQHSIIYLGKNFSVTSGIFRPNFGGHVDWEGFCTPRSFVTMCAAGPLAGIASNIALFYGANKLAEKDYSKSAAFLNFVATCQANSQLSNLHINNMNPPYLDGEHIANKLNFSKNMKRAWNGSVWCARAGVCTWGILLTAHMGACALHGIQYKDMPGFLEILAKVKDLLS